MEKVGRLNASAAKLTFGDVAENYTNTVMAAKDLKARSREYNKLCITMIQRTWRGLAGTHIREIKSSDCETWLAKRMQ